MSLVRRKDVVVLALAIGAAGTVGVPAGLLASAGPTTAPAETSVQGVSITGTVFFESQPVSGAQVFLVRHYGKHDTTQPSAADPADQKVPGAGRAAKVLGVADPHKADHRDRKLMTTETDSDGHFTMTNIPAGRYVIVARMKKEGRAHNAIEVGTGTMPPLILELEHHGPTTAPAN